MVYPKIVFFGETKVASEKKKMTICIVGVAFFVLALLFRTGNTTAESNLVTVNTTKQLTINDANPGNNNLKNFSSAGSMGAIWLRMVFAIFIVIALGVGTIYLSKKFLPKLTHGSGKEIQVLETVHLGQRKSLHLLKIGNHKILIGSTNEQISRIADLTDFGTELLDNTPV